MKLTKTIAAVLTVSALISCKGEINTTNNTENMKSNQVIETIMARRSIRQYKAEPVKRETMQTILECGINAPSGMNKQSWEVRVLDNPQSIEKLKSYMVQANPEVSAQAVEGCWRGAPTLVVIANAGDYDFSAIDCGLLSQNIMLSAWSMGVGSVCLGSPIRYINKSAEALQMLGFSEGYTPIIAIGLGYSDEKPEAKPRDMGKVKFIE